MFFDPENIKKIFDKGFHLDLENSSFDGWFNHHPNCKSEFIYIEPEPRAMVNGLFHQRLLSEVGPLFPHHDLKIEENEFLFGGVKVRVDVRVPKNTIWVIVPTPAERPSDMPSIKVVKILEPENGG